LAIAAVAAVCCGAAPGLRTEIDTAAVHLELIRDALNAEAAELAAALGGSIPVIYGNDLTVPVAYRWKTQVNENAKWHAFANALPEVDHNEIVGWDGLDPGAAGAPAVSAIFLSDRDSHPRELERIKLTAGLIEQHTAAVHVVETAGETRTERLLHAVMLGDLLSLHLAALRGVDPTPVAVIDRLKDELGKI
jgi:glucose/mannose-6-phosphate isomerase